jgi:hypothetical protein
MQSENYIPYSPFCSNDSQWYLNEANQTFIAFQDSDKYFKKELDKVKNITSLISDVYAEAYLNCHMSVVDVYMYYLM